MLPCSPKRLTKISKYLSYHLRHHPEALGLELAPGGWVEVAALLSAAREQGFHISPQELEAVVAQNDKKRFAFDPSHSHIRANQGHSVPVDLQLETRSPPKVLYHGTSDRAVVSIQRHGLQKQSRHHVHLSLNLETARQVGKRRGRPRVFEVDTAAMLQDNYQFYCSENHVWLVDSVPPQYLTLII